MANVMTTLGSTREYSSGDVVEDISERRRPERISTVRGRSSAAVSAGLTRVPDGRFQILDVSSDVPISRFVSEHDLVFRVGRGFYEFTKPETIQENKEIVLMERGSGDIYTGAEAREFIGLPYGRRGKVDPGSIGGGTYRVFVQSTSANRVLKGNTTFLYEVE
jgi:hypothetical protein